MDYSKFRMTRDINGYNSFGLTFTGGWQAKLPAATAKSITIPDKANLYLAVFSFEPGDSVWVAKNTTATVPPSADFTETTSAQNPTAREVRKGETLSFITNGTDVEVGVELYALE